MLDEIATDVELTEFADYLHSPQEPKAAPALQERLVAMTVALFPGPVRMETEIDPDFPEDRRFIVEVQAEGEFRDILNRELKWHDKLWELVGKSAGMQFSLCVFPK
jgi:hypothetical protein